MLNIVNSSNLRILLVEDNAITRLYVQALLESYGCDVVIAKNGEEAVTNFGSHIDGVLMDIGLPDINGCQATRRIRQKYPKENTLIYACSAFDRNCDLMCEQFGMNGFIQKPCRRNEVEDFLLAVNKKITAISSISVMERQAV